jgi:hypothetical protein
MSSYTDAVESIKVFAARVEGITKVAQVLERIGSLEDAEREILARVDAARKAETQAQLASQESVGELKRIQGQAVLDKQDADRVAQSIRDQAERDAAKVVSDAQARALSVVSEAQAKASQIVEPAKAKAAEALTTAAEKREQADEAQARIVAATKELDVLTLRIASAKSQAARILAGE